MVPPASTLCSHRVLTLRRLLTINTDYISDFIRPIDFYNEKCDRLLWGRNWIIIYRLDELTNFEQRAMVKAVSCLIAENRVRSPVSPVGNAVDEVPLWQVFLKVFQFYPVSINPLMSHTRIYSYTCCSYM